MHKKSLILVIIIFLILTLSISASERSVYNSACRYGDDASEYFNRGYELLLEIADFDYTDGNDVEASMRELEGEVRRCTQAARYFEDAKSKYGSAYREWDYYLDEYYWEADDEYIAYARESRDSAELNIDKCDNNIAVANAWKARHENTLKILVHGFEKREEERRIGEATGIAPADTYSTIGFGIPDWGSSMDEVISLVGNDRYYQGEEFLVYLGESNDYSGNRIIEIVIKYYFHQNKMVKVEYSYEFENEDIFNQVGESFYNNCVSVFGTPNSSDKPTSESGSYNIGWNKPVYLHGYWGNTSSNVIDLRFKHPYWKREYNSAALLPEEYRNYGYYLFDRLIDNE